MISSNVSHIGYGAFGGCKRWISIEVDPNNEYYESKDDVYLIRKNAVLCNFHQGKMETTQSRMESIQFNGIVSMIVVV